MPNVTSNFDMFDYVLLFSKLDIVLDDGFGNRSCASRTIVDERADKIPFGGEFHRLLLVHLEPDLHIGLAKRVQPCPDDDPLCECNCPLELNVKSLLVPVPAALDEFLHRHAIASTHLIVACKEYVVQIPGAVDVVVHVNIVGSDDEFGVEAFVLHIGRYRVRIVLCSGNKFTSINSFYHRRIHKQRNRGQESNRDKVIPDVVCVIIRVQELCRRKRLGVRTVHIEKVSR
jgi:hypothetical protein